MIDTDLYILPTIAHYFLDIPQGKPRTSSFLSHTSALDNSNINVTYHDLLARNALYNLQRAEPFALHPTASNLLHLRPGQPVGNWRDSNQGLGYGVVPFDVNVALVPASLRALARLSKAGLLKIKGHPDAGTKAEKYAEIWEKKASTFFEVKVAPKVAESRLKDFVVRANLTDSLLTAAGGQRKNEDVEFFALSLNDNGSQVDVCGFLRDYYRT